MGTGRIKFLRPPVWYFGDSLYSSSNPEKLFSEICGYKFFILE